jgi:hypothetical protein
MTLFEASLFGFTCAAAWVLVCSCVVPKYVGVVVVHATFTVGSSFYLCSGVVYRSVYVRRKGDNNKLHCRRKYIARNATGCSNTTL